MEEICIGVLGHVDHGKTTIVKALTNKDTDQLKEEKERGISINIAFSFYQAPKKLIGFIDLPGHEKFIKNMIAGASNVNAGLLVVACDDGMMPQTYEHLLVFKLFDIKNLIVVYSKTDLVNPEQVQETKQVVEKYLATNDFEVFGSVGVNNKDEKSYQALKKILNEFSEKFNAQKLNSELPHYRLDIDRSFTLPGKGTIITGTSKQGRVKEGDELLISPQNQLVKVREIQVNEKKVDQAHAGQRTALRISNINYNDVTRGDIIATPGILKNSKLIDVYLNYDTINSEALKNKVKVQVFIGTKYYLAKLNILGQKIINPGEKVFCQLEFDTPVYFQIDEIGIIKPIESDVVAGGFQILRSSVKAAKPKNQDYLGELHKIKFGNFIDQLLVEIKNSPDKIVNLESFGYDESQVNHNELIVFKNNAIHIDNYNALKEIILFRLKKYHVNNTLRMGMNYLELSSVMKDEMDVKHLNFLLNLMIKEGLIKIENQMYSLKTFELKLSKDQHSIKNLLIRRMKDWKLKPEEISAIKDKVSDTKTFNEILKYLLHNKSIVQLDEVHFVTTTNYQKAVEKIELFLDSNQSISINEAKILLDLNHKYTILILEKMDYDKITIFKDDVRIKNNLLN